MTELCDLSAVELRRLIGRKKVSPLELLDSCLMRIRATDGAINAMVALDEKAARKAARDAEQAVMRGEDLGLLHGLPVGVKDLSDTAGLKTTYGSLIYKDHVPTKDAAMVARVRAEGAIIVGKTNTPEFTLGIGARTTDNLIYGTTLNPYDLTYQPGGSSGGSAANVAAGGASFDIGSDWYGSIRDPSNACGVVGLKPTHGLCPRTGHIIGYGGLFDSFQQVGPIARYAEDIALVLPIIAGPDNWDAATQPVPVGDPAAVDILRLRVAFYPNNGLNPPTAEMEALVKRCAKLFEDAGCRVTHDMPPKMSELAGARSDFSSTTGGYLTRKLLERAGTKEPYPHLPMGGEEKPTADLTRFAEELDAARSEQLAWFENYDIILCPGSLRAALPLDRDVPPPPPPPSKDGKPRRSPYYLGVYNSNGWPAGVVRAGTSTEDAGMPLGVQVIGRPWRDDQVIAALAYIERQLGGYRRPAL